MLFAMFMPGPFEIAVIGVVAVLLFGSKLPALARSLGSAIPSFRQGLRDISDEATGVSDELNSVSREAKDAIHVK